MLSGALRRYAYTLLHTPPSLLLLSYYQPLITCHNTLNITEYIAYCKLSCYAYHGLPASLFTTLFIHTSFTFRHAITSYTKASPTFSAYHVVLFTHYAAILLIYITLPHTRLMVCWLAHYMSLICHSHYNLAYITTL